MNIQKIVNWSKGNVINSNVEIGQLNIIGNNISFHLNGYGDIFARNFVGKIDMHVMKIYTYGQSIGDSDGYFYKVSKAFLYNGADYSDFTDENIDSIEGFSFEIPEISEWLNIKSVNNEVLEDKLVVYELPTPVITLHNDSDLSICIKYETKSIIENLGKIDDMSIKKIPRIYVKFMSPQNDLKVISIIEIIMRFFALLIGRITIADNIQLMLNGRQFQMILFVNHDFSVNAIGNAYLSNLRTKLSDFSPDKLQALFDNWYAFSNNLTSQILADAYFNTCSKQTLTIEDVFLTYCRFIEGYDLRKSNDETNANYLEEKLNLIFKDNNLKKAVAPLFKEVGSKYTSKEISRWIATGFVGRISLSDRIRRVDKNFFSLISSNFESDPEIFSKMSKTRNYYSHFKTDPTGILSLGEIYTILPILESTVITIFFSILGIDDDAIKHIMLKDDLFSHYSLCLQVDD